MPANTAKGYPYPVGTDRVMDGDDAIRNLAQAVNDKVGTACTGTATVPITAVNTMAEIAITFPRPFVDVPAVVAMPINNSAPHQIFVTAASITTTGFTLRGIRTQATTSFLACWIAVNAA